MKEQNTQKDNIGQKIQSVLWLTSLSRLFENLRNYKVELHWMRVIAHFSLLSL